MLAKRASAAFIPSQTPSWHKVTCASLNTLSLLNLTPDSCFHGARRWLSTSSVSVVPDERQGKQAAATLRRLSSDEEYRNEFFLQASRHIKDLTGSGLVNLIATVALVGDFHTQENLELLHQLMAKDTIGSFDFQRGDLLLLHHANAALYEASQRTSLPIPTLPKLMESYTTRVYQDHSLRIKPYAEIICRAMRHGGIRYTYKEDILDGLYIGWAVARTPHTAAVRQAQIEGRVLEFIALDSHESGTAEQSQDPEQHLSPVLIEVDGDWNYIPGTTDISLSTRLSRRVSPYSFEHIRSTHHRTPSP